MTYPALRTSAAEPPPTTASAPSHLPGDTHPLADLRAAPGAASPRSSPRREARHLRQVMQQHRRHPPPLQRRLPPGQRDHHVRPAPRVGDPGDKHNQQDQIEHTHLNRLHPDAPASTPAGTPARPPITAARSAPLRPAQPPRAAPPRAPTATAPVIP
jgi:hypothetical protein